MSIVGIDANKR